MALFVLLSQSSDNLATDLNRALTEAGYAVLDHALGSTPTVEFGSVLVAIIDATGKLDAALAQTRRWRAELGDELVPIVWVLPNLTSELATRALDAGADVVLSQPLEKDVLIAQVRAAARLRTFTARVATRVEEARLLGEQLRKAYKQIDREQDAARRVHQAFLPKRLPKLGAARFAVSHRPRNKVAGDFYDVRILDENRIGFFLGDVVGCGTAGSLIGVFVAQSVAMTQTDETGFRVVLPDKVLSQVNHELLGLGFEDRPVVALLAATLHTLTGELILARAGLPTPVYIPAGGEPQLLPVPGPFLGTADASYSTITTTLRSGDKLVFGTDGTHPEGNPIPAGNTQLLEAVSRYRNLSGQGFVDTVASDLLTALHHTDDFTLLCLELAKV
jgi:sigma-B regulation protein RsbU (phosphoserine phosphatase)